MRSTCSSTSFSSRRTRLALGPERLAHQVQVALDHRDRVVDLVRDAGGELADGGQLLADQLLPAPCSSRVRSATLGSSSSCERCSARVLSSMVSSSWSRWPARRPISSLPSATCARAARSPASTGAWWLHALDRAKMLRAQRSESKRDGHHAEQDRADAGQHAVLHQRERAFEKAHVQHADAPACASVSGW